MLCSDISDIYKKAYCCGRYVGKIRYSKAISQIAYVCKRVVNWMANMWSCGKCVRHGVVVIRKKGSSIFAFTLYHKSLLSRQHVCGFIICDYFVVCMLLEYI